MYGEKFTKFKIIICAKCRFIDILYSELIFVVHGKNYQFNEISTEG